MGKRVAQTKFPTALIPKKKRVAAYARVSSGKDAMLHSLSEQIRYYSAMIQQRSDWEYAGVYADEATTGTKENRAEFQRMLAACREGQIDLILTKSISRFARNTVTLLETVRGLKNIHVDVFFEREQIHSMSGDGELMLSMLASFAQEESRSVSDNCKWRIRNNFRQGTPSCCQILGYRWMDGRYEIVPEEAETVRMIFRDYLSGMGRVLIHKKLLELGLPTKTGGQWTDNGIAHLLRNEKYCGDLMLQKTYVSDPITKKKCINHGELKRYYVRDAHEAIVSREDFERVQEILRAGQEKYQHNPQAPAHYPFTGKIECGVCGAMYRRKIAGSEPKYKKPVWICQTFNQLGKQACASKQIPDDILESVTASVLENAAFDPGIFERKIECIRVIGPNRLLFIFRDGHRISREWQDASRKWSDEQKEAARKRYYEQLERSRAHE
ncbi:MAG: recombinase family protein [Eubacteriales bacterium]|nr:recombinase family protein [Eubacteriales bacterium]